MKPSLPQSEFDAQVRRHEQLTRSTRVLYGLEPRDDQPSTPFDWLRQVVGRALEVFAVAVLVVVFVALLFSRGGPTS